MKKYKILYRDYDNETWILGINAISLKEAKIKAFDCYDVLKIVTIEEVQKPNQL